MMMNAHGAPTSLLASLNSAGNEFRLRIRLTEGEDQDAEPGPTSFLLIDGPKSFTRIVAAQIITSTERVVMDLFILQQSDDYPTADTEIWPLTNADVEARWQHAGKAYQAMAAQGPRHRSPLLLSGQIQPDGRMVAFHSLFYCMFTKTFFHPPCPSCGGDLRLCTDDHLLKSFGLDAYTHSLSRYLYCSKCVSLSTAARFFAFSRKPSEPACVLDQGSLINQFANLMVRDIEPQLQFPCTECGEQGVCYGVENIVDQRMVSYSFYPFFAFLFEADTFQAADFLMLLSGASFEILAERAAAHHWHGRLDVLQTARSRLGESALRLYPASSNQGFLEVLYLKLSFLEDLLDGLLPSRYAEIDGGTFSLDRVWVRVPEQNGYLPALWNFNVHYLGFGADVNSGMHLFPNPLAHRLYFLANVWFFAMLTNSRQDMRTVRPGLEKMLSAADRFSAEHDQPTFLSKNPAFAPENLFWDSPDLPVSELLYPFWEKTLALGMELLSAAVKHESLWSEKHFREGIRQLRQDLKGQLFRAEAAADSVAAEDLRISIVLKKILLKWQTRETPASVEAVPGDYPEGRIRLPREPLPGKASSAPEEEFIPETVQLRVDRLSKPFAAPEAWKQDADRPVSLAKSPPSRGLPSKDRDAGDELVLETVILRADPGAAGRNQTGAEPSRLAETDIPKTVILSAGEAARQQHPQPPSGAGVSERPDHPAGEGDLSRTKVLAPALKTENGSGEGDLAETVIIRTQKKDP